MRVRMCENMNCCSSFLIAATESAQVKSWSRQTVLPICLTDLIGAPVPGGLNGESKHKARPRQVSGNRVPKNMEGVCPRLVAARTDVSRDRRDGLEVQVMEFFIASHLIES